MFSGRICKRESVSQCQQTNSNLWTTLVYFHRISPVYRDLLKYSPKVKKIQSHSVYIAFKNTISAP